MSNRDHLHCIMDEKTSNQKFGADRPSYMGVSYCGQEIMAWWFTSCDHAINTGRSGSHMSACKQCVLKAIELLQEASE